MGKGRRQVFNLKWPWSKPRPSPDISPRAIAKARYEAAVKRGDTRDQHTAWLQLVAATNVELGARR